MERRYVGRGGKRGKTSGRGTKGQNSRAGRKKRPELRDIIKKIPKARGYKFKSIRKPVWVSKAKIGGKKGEGISFSKLRKEMGLKGGKIKINK